MNKKTKIFIVIFFSIILIPVIIIGTINYTKEQALKNRIENRTNSRILSLNSISTAITLNELLDIEMSKEYSITDRKSKYDNDQTKTDFDVKYTNTSFFGIHCIKEYLFVDERLHMIIFDIDTSHWMPKDIYEEIVKTNGEPDETNVKSDKYHRDMYIWYGKNGSMIYTDDGINDTIEIVFEIKE